MISPEVTWGRHEGAGVHKNAPPPNPLFPPPPEFGGSGTNVHPFQVVDASAAGTAKVTVRFGQVNNVTPTIGGTPLTNNSPPELTVVTGFVYLDCTVDSNGLVTAVVVSNGAAVPADTSTHAYRTLAGVTVAAGAVTNINQSIRHSLGHQKCGTTIHNFWGV